MNFGITLGNYEYGKKNVEGIDYSAIRETSQEIFARASRRNNALNNVDLSKFNRVDKGLDLYSGRVDANLAKAISLQNAGKNVQLSNEVLTQIQYLNMQAAKIANQNPYKEVEGKIPVNPNDAVANSEREYAPLPNTTQFFDIDNLARNKQQSSGNPFSSNYRNSHK